MDHHLLQSWIEQLVEEEMEVIVQEIRIFAHSRQIFAGSIWIILQRHGRRIYSSPAKALRNTAGTDYKLQLWDLRGSGMSVAAVVAQLPSGLINSVRSDRVG